MNTTWEGSYLEAVIRVLSAGIMGLKANENMTHGNDDKINYQRNTAIIFKDFWPISLIGGIYKIISKVLVNCFRRVAHGLISDS